jgi:hypothetical protein
MLKKILIALALLIVALVAVVAFQPAEFRITRAARIAAAPEVVFPLFNDFRKWNDWSPWAKVDPNAKYTFEGPDAGVGAKFAWAGNNEVGEGVMTITESKPSERVAMKLEFFKPFAATSTTEFTLQPDGGGTAVTWSMSGRNNFIAKAVGMFMDCDKMVGGDFEKGLANLKAVVETPEKK